MLGSGAGHPGRGGVRLAGGDISGDWQFTARVLNDVSYARVTLKVEGEKLTGTLNEIKLERHDQGRRAELSPSTFRILAREFSSRRVTSRVVLKERCQRLADHHPDADHVPPAATL